MRLYADAAALAAYPGGDTIPSGDVDAALRTASRVVDIVLEGVVYATDAEGMPTDEDVVQALSDAVCAIAVEAKATGATAPGSTQEWDQVGIGSVKLGGRKTKSGTSTVAGVPIPTDAILALQSVGPVRVWVS